MPSRFSNILHDHVPIAPWMADHTLRLPGTVPVTLADWLQRDEAFAGQMALRDWLIAERPAEVHALTPGARRAAEELLGFVLSHLADVPGYTREGEVVRRPDGVLVPLAGPPLLVAGRLVQEDLLILEKPEGGPEHLLTGAVLCFPSNWTLSQKFGMPLSRIHLPVDAYDEALGRRVQRMCDAIRPDAPVMRANLSPSAHANLHSPRPEYSDYRPGPGETRFVRVERQTLLRLPESRAIVFSIHIYQLPLDRLPEAEAARLREVRPAWFA